MSSIHSKSAGLF